MMSNCGTLIALPTVQSIADRFFRHQDPAMSAFSWSIDFDVIHTRCAVIGLRTECTLKILGQQISTLFASNSTDGSQDTHLAIKKLKPIFLQGAKITGPETNGPLAVSRHQACIFLSKWPETAAEEPPRECLRWRLLSSADVLEA
jgi:hypothetical protein